MGHTPAIAADVSEVGPNARETLGRLHPVGGVDPEGIVVGKMNETGAKLR